MPARAAGLALRAATSALLAVTLALVAPAGGTRAAVPAAPGTAVQPMAIYGTVVDAAGVSIAGSTVQAFLDGQAAGAVPVGPPGYFGSAGAGEQLLVAGTAAQSGDPVTFLVDGTPATASPAVAWQAGATAAGVTLTVTLPLVTAVTPASGLPGATVRILGSGFAAATGVRFGAQPASFIVASDTAIDATVPPGGGVVDVSVATASGSSVPSPSDRFAYTGQGSGGSGGSSAGGGSSSGGAGTAKVGTGSAGGASPAAGGGSTGSTGSAPVGTSGSGGRPSAASPATAGQAAVGPVGSAGGTLETADGAFTLAVPVGDVPGNGSLGVSESCAPPAGIPADTSAASCVFTLSGASLTEPAAATFAFHRAALGGLPVARLSVYRQDADGTWSYQPTAVTGTAASAYVSGPETVAVLADTQRFQDVPAGYWAAPAIDRIVAASLADGFLDGTFRPGAPLSRAQLAKLTVLALGLPVGSGTSVFGDVPPSAWFAPYVAAAAQAGILRGMAASTFDPGAPVSREQLAVVLARALGLKAGAPAPSFSDAGGVDPWAVSAVAETAAAGLLVGLPDGSFRPLAATTRAAAAEALARVIRRLAPPAPVGSSGVAVASAGP